jgi:hypothetical protein
MLSIIPPSSVLFKSSKLETDYMPEKVDSRDNASDK